MTDGRNSGITYTIKPIDGLWHILTDKWLNGEGRDLDVFRGHALYLETALDYVRGLEKQALIEQTKRTNT